MIGKDRVMQDEIVISVCPIVTNIGVLLDDQIWNSQSIEACSDHETILATANDEYGGV